MAQKKTPALHLASFRVKPRTIRAIDALVVQHDENAPDLWRAALERGVPIVALLYGADPSTHQYGLYTADELAVLIQPTAALIQGFLLARGTPLPLTASQLGPTAPADQGATLTGAAALPMDAAVAEALAGLGIDLDL